MKAFRTVPFLFLLRRDCKICPVLGLVKRSEYESQAVDDISTVPFLVVGGVSSPQDRAQTFLQLCDQALQLRIKLCAPFGIFQ